MSSPYTHIRLTDVKDSAPELGTDGNQETRFAQGDLGAEQTGVSHHRFKPGKRQAFGHRHERAEEVYLVLSGSGRIKLDDEILELQPLEAVRIAPPVTRAIEAGPGGIEVIVFGPHHEGDGELTPDWWSD
jgi:mannose-6-phosphate isomerase-like protein (cupin superfamily)